MSYDLAKIDAGGLIHRGDDAPTRTLIVLVHGWRLNNNQWRPLIELAAADAQFATCDFYIFSFRRGSKWSAGLEQLGAALASSIDLHAGKYGRIILVGYSIGGLIVRTGFLTALGVASRQGHSWARKVHRIVLMATPNRGLGGPGANLYRRFQIFLARVLGPRLLKDTIKGSDFITRLRLDWVHAFRSPDLPTPEVIQLLGVKDQYVNADDSNDVTIFQEAKLFTVANARHGDLAAFRSVEDEKYLRFRMCCFAPIDALVGEEQSAATPPSCVVFQLHGIRDYGGWLAKFAKTAREIDPRAKVVAPGYGWFSVLDFLIPWRRRRRISWFCDRYTEEVAALATCVEDVPFYFVGHSYGTYLLAQCLERFPRMHFRRAYLLGSVVNEQFQWADLIQRRRQLEGLRNDCASHDWPVAIGCRVLNQFGVRDLGIGGFVGFRAGVPEAIDHLHIPGNHSITLTDETLRRGAAEYLLLSNNAEPRTVPAPTWLRLASRFAVPLALFLGLALGPLTLFGIDAVAHWLGIASHFVVGAVVLFGILVLIYI
jgi:pimeloyl-ACP methyl ester carboxylesterase